MGVSVDPFVISADAVDWAVEVAVRVVWVPRCWWGWRSDVDPLSLVIAAY